MSGLKSLMTAIRGPGEFAGILDELRGIFGGLALYSPKGAMADRLKEVKSRLETLKGREAEKNQKKLSILKHIYIMLLAMDNEDVEKFDTLIAFTDRINTSGEEATVVDAKNLLARIIQEMKVKQEAKAKLNEWSLLQAKASMPLLPTASAAERANYTAAKKEWMALMETPEQRKQKDAMFARIERVYGYKRSNLMRPDKFQAEVNVITDFFRRRQNAKKSLGLQFLSEDMIEDKDEQQIKAILEKRGGGGRRRSTRRAHRKNRKTRRGHRKH
jgi:hypothetical protein